VNLYWHGCMAKSELPAQALLGHGLKEIEKRV
jgi:hypothetical protein